MRVNAFDRDVPKRSRHGHTARLFQHRGETLFIAKFVNRRALHCAVHRNLRACRGDQQRVAALQPVIILAHTMQQKIIQIDFPDQLVIAKMP